MGGLQHDRQGTSRVAALARARPSTAPGAGALRDESWAVKKRASNAAFIMQKTIWLDREIVPTCAVLSYIHIDLYKYTYVAWLLGALRQARRPNALPSLDCQTSVAK